MAREPSRTPPASAAAVVPTAIAGPFALLAARDTPVGIDGLGALSFTVDAASWIFARGALLDVDRVDWLRRRDDDEPLREDEPLRLAGRDRLWPARDFELLRLELARDAFPRRAFAFELLRLELVRDEPFAPVLDELRPLDPLRAAALDERRRFAGAERLFLEAVFASAIITLLLRFSPASPR